MTNGRNGIVLISLGSVLTALLTLNGFMLGAIRADIKVLDNKIFNHLTNDDIHVVRSYVVSQAEFDMHCKYKDEQIDKFNKSIVDLRTEIINRIK